MAMVIENSQIYETITLPDIPNLRDQNDKIILAAALTAQANIIITGDNDLLILKDFQDIPIMTAKTFIDQYFPEI
jgi:putative PIN family toxin of toxin-antitoxin system